MNTRSVWSHWAVRGGDMPGMPVRHTREKKLNHFFRHIPKNARILDVGCGDGWVGRYALAHGWIDVTGIDIVPPARALRHPFVLGDVNQWRELGLEPESYDVAVAFDVLEHGDFFAALRALLRPGGRLLVTTPLPHMDWLCEVLERIRLSRPRTAPRPHLTHFRDIPSYFIPMETTTRAGVSQWGVFRRTTSCSGRG